MFSKPEIKELLRPYTLVKLYTDVVPDDLYAPEVRSKFAGSVTRQRADAKVNYWFQEQTFGDVRLPLYVILEPLQDGTIKVVDRYDEGKINNESAFAQFLKEPWD